ILAEVGSQLRWVKYSPGLAEQVVRRCWRASRFFLISRSRPNLKWPTAHQSDILRRVAAPLLNTTRIAFLCALALAAAGLDKRVVLRPSAKPIGPYSPGIFAGDYLYISGQGSRMPDGQLPPTFEAQARQCFENVKSVLEAAGLTMENVVYTHVYLADTSNYDAM